LVVTSKIAWYKHSLLQCSIAALIEALSPERDGEAQMTRDRRPSTAKASVNSSMLWPSRYACANAAISAAVSLC
jgi:hypothetical protein